MYNQSEDIIKQYGLTANQITKGRGAYICETDQGMKLLVPYAGSEERARFLRDFLRFLKEAGFPCEQIITNSAGGVICEDAYGEKYLCKDMISGSECSTRSREEMKEAAKMLAFFHKVSAGCLLEIPQRMKDYGDDLDEICRKRTREMLRVRNYVQDKKHKGEFERRFLQEYPRFAAQAGRAEEMLEPVMKNIPGRILVHGDFSQHSIKKSSDGWRIVNFEHLSYSWAMTDLANYLRKMMEKNNWQIKLGQEIIEAYDSVDCIHEADRQILCVLLWYPEKFRKLSNRYSGSHKAWLSQRSLEKLDRLAAQEEARKKFLDFL